MYIWQDEEKKKEYNKKLIEKYPFLTPRNVWSSKSIIDCAGEDGEEGYWPGDPTSHPEYDYEYTELDNMPDGWRAAFGEQMCQEIKEELIKSNSLDNYYITQIKEKFGTLRWYDNGGSEEHYDIIMKYEQISAETCINCGAPAKWISTGWISPFCDKCAHDIYNKSSVKNNYQWEDYFTDINDYL